MEIPSNALYNIFDVFKFLFEEGSMPKKHVLIENLDIDSKFELIRLKSYGWLEINDGIIRLTERGKSNIHTLIYNGQKNRRTA